MQRCETCPTLIMPAHHLASRVPFLLTRCPVSLCCLSSGAFSSSGTSFMVPSPRSFPSLYQKPREGEQEPAFKRSIGIMGVRPPSARRASDAMLRASDAMLRASDAMLRAVELTPVWCACVCPHRICTRRPSARASCSSRRSHCDPKSTTGRYACGTSRRASTRRPSARRCKSSARSQAVSSACLSSCASRATSPPSQRSERPPA